MIKKLDTLDLVKRRSRKKVKQSKTDYYRMSQKECSNCINRYFDGLVKCPKCGEDNEEFDEDDEFEKKQRMRNF